MARAETKTKLSLDHWARLMGVNPLHFNTVGIPALRTPVCDSIWFQHSWQGADAASREDVARCIAEAEANIENQLGYRLLPSWEEDEWSEASRPPRVEEMFAGRFDLRGYGEVIPTQWKQFLSGGVRSSDLVDDGVAIAWSDVDGDGYDETGTVTAATTALNSCEIHVYYPGKSGAPEWEIRPAKVSIAGGVATITFRRELCVLEDIQEALVNEEQPQADGMDDADFLATADVYRVYNDPQRQAQLLWEPISSCYCGTTGCELCAFTTQWACLHSRGNRALGQVVYSPATWDAATKTFTAIECLYARPDIVRLWYYAGWRGQSVDCPDVELDPVWARTVAYYAAALLDRPPCTCNAQRFEHWQEDLAYIRGSSELSQYSIAIGDLENPFGTRRGAVNAWKQVSMYGRQQVGVALIH